LPKLLSRRAEIKLRTLVMDEGFGTQDEEGLDNLLWPLLVVQSEEMKTIPLYIVKFMAEKHTDEGAMMALLL